MPSQQAEFHAKFKYNKEMEEFYRNFEETNKITEK
jgi:hypothetical protein